MRNRIKPTSNSPNPEAQTHTRIPTRRPDPSLQYPRSTHTKCLSKCLTEFPRTPSRVPEHIPITPGSRSKDLGHHRSFSATTKPLPRSIDTTPIIISVTNLHPQPQPSSTISASAPIPISNHLQPQRFPPHLHRYGSHHQPHDSIPFTISAIEATIRTARSSQFIYHPQFDQPQRSTFPNSNPQPQQAKAHNLLDEMSDRAYLGNDQDTIEPCPDKPSRDRYSARAYQLFDEMPEPTPRLRSGFLGHLLGHHQPLLEQPDTDPATYPTPRTPKTHTPRTPRTPKTHTPRTPRTPKTHTPRTPRTPKTHTPRIPRTPKTHTPRTPRTPKTHNFKNTKTYQNSQIHTTKIYKLSKLQFTSYQFYLRVLFKPLLTEDYVAGVMEENYGKSEMILLWIIEIVEPLFIGEVTTIRLSVTISNWKIIAFSLLLIIDCFPFMVENGKHHKHKECRQTKESVCERNPDSQLYAQCHIITHNRISYLMNGTISDSKKNHHQ
ncbi:hypothetical protein LXL04_028290 [Taraxacum kok-saghyz]